MSLRSGFDLPHYDSPEAVHIESLLTSALVSFAQAVQHDNELMFYHHIFMQFAYEVEEMESLAQVDFAKMMKTVIKTDSESMRFYRDVADIYNCLDQNGLAVKLEKLWQSLNTQQPLSPDSASNPILTKTISQSTEYYNLIKSGQRIEALELAQKHADSFVLSDVLDENQFQQYIQATMEAEGEDKDNVSLDIYEDGFVQCMCNFCGPRIAAWEMLREQGQLPETSEVQNMMINYVELDLRAISDMTSSSASGGESPSGSDLSTGDSSSFLEFE